MISIVVITQNRAAELRHALGHLARLSPQPPIVVVDNASTDDTPRVVAAAGPKVEGVRLARNEGAAARNVGVATTGTPYVAFSDDDSWWARDALQRAVEIFERTPRLGLIAARVLVGPGERLDPICLDLATSPLPRPSGMPGPSVLGFLACGAIVRRRAFLEAGGFHRRLGVGGEERLLAIDLMRLGWQLAYCADVVAHHHPAAAGMRPGRRAHMVRNELWTAWLRYRATDALRLTASMARRAAMASSERPGLVAALRGLPWVMRERVAVDPVLQEQLRQIR